jgi:hypothetical protein
MISLLARVVGIVAMGAPILASASGTDALNMPGKPASLLLAAGDMDLPLSKDALFEVPPAADKDSKKVSKQATEDGPESKDALFGIDSKTEPGRAPATKMGKEAPTSETTLFGDGLLASSGQDKAASRWHGFFQTELAYAVPDPAHWSKVMGRLELGTEGKLGQGINWKASGRLDYNAAYDLTNFYQSSVRDGQQLGFQFRETYLDFTGGGLDWRVGRQHIVWGEMVGLFVADVVSAKDLREFILPDFQVVRIPQWAARAEY